MAEANVESKEMSQKEPSENLNGSSVQKPIIEENINEAKVSNSKPNNVDGKREFTEEEKLKRKEFFKRKRLIAKEKFLQRNGTSRGLRITGGRVRKPLGGRVRILRSGKIITVLSGRDILSNKISQEETKMLEFYKVRLSTLRRENENLHRTLAELVSENMRLLQRGPV